MPEMLGEITLRKKPRQTTMGLLTLGTRTVPCALGRSGLGPIKLEGNGITPLMQTRILYGFYRPDKEKRPVSVLPFFPLEREMGWCDAPGHPSYNRLVQLPFSESHERMWRDDDLYDLVLVLDININPRANRRGSALFMHVARPDYSPTEGCIALAKPDLRHLLAVISPETRLTIAR
nr:L,D-transpeptidase family protein [uncultured Cohaesibacter sp.]